MLEELLHYLPFFFSSWDENLRSELRGAFIFHLLAHGGGGRQDCGEGCYVMLECLIGGLF